MQLVLKKSFFLFLVISGFIIFFLNLPEVNLSKNNINSILESNNKKLLKINNKNTKIEKSKIDFSKNKLNNTEPIKDLKKIVVKVKKGQTFSEILDSFKFIKSEKFEIINAINQEFDLRTLNINQEIYFFANHNQKIEKIILELNFNTNLVVDLTNKIDAKKIILKTFSNIDSKEYFITTSLYKDGINNNVPNEILVKLIQLFSFDLDFQRDIKKDTEVSISYQIINIENKDKIIFGDIEYARIKINNNDLEYFKFLTDDGFIDYFNKDGKNVKKSLLKTPLDGARLSSNFGMRKHPISGFNKMHKGIDFAAPKGTPIYAGGNGVVEYIGNNGGYGKYIRIRHNNDYKTAYAHLSGYKKGIKKGSRLKQGEIIGYVGSTGLSTGPHLHYEILYKNKQINPLTLKLPSGKILKGKELERFKKDYKMILANHLNNLYE